jgi:hypothetical protein
MVLVNSVALSLDAALFGSVAGDTVRPPGLLNGRPSMRRRATLIRQ